MSEISINIGFIILGVVGLYLITIGICNYIENRIKLHYNRGFQDAVFVRDKIEEKIENDLEKWIVEQTSKSAGSEGVSLEPEHLKRERFLDDLQKMKDKADDFANQLEMRSTERDAKEYQSKLKIIK